MHDIRFIRENPEAFDAGLGLRGVEPQSAQILALDAEKRDMQTRLQSIQQERNRVAKEIGQAKKQGDEKAAQAAMSRAEEIRTAMQELETKLNEDEGLEALLAGLPNLPHEDVPVGEDEEANVELRQEGVLPAFDFEPKWHDELAQAKEEMDFETAAAMSGARFVLLSGELARLERRLASFMLDIHTQEFGYREVVPPLLVRDGALFGTGQLPKFEEDLFATGTGHYLIPTAEVPLTNIVAGQILSEEYLPRRYTAYTPCFRAEAGAAGRDTRGMIRQHQFSKVELVSVTRPEDAAAEHERMLAAAETVLKRLEIPYRIMLLSTGDMGFSARKTYDIEVWLPGQKQYREISSISDCGDFQARRMKARYRMAGEKQTRFVHTLNGSGLAVGRTIVAILENYQQADGRFALPAALAKY